MTLSALEISLLAGFCGLLSGLAGGYGGRVLAMLPLRRELALYGAELEAFGIRIAKVEGRANREKVGQPPKELAELAALLQQRSGPAGFVSQANRQETEAEIIARTFPAPKKSGPNL